MDYMNSFLELNERMSRILQTVAVSFSLIPILITTFIKYHELSSISFHPWAYWVSLVGFLIISVSQFIVRPTTNRRCQVYVVGFTILGLIISVFVAGYNNGIFMIGWLMLIIVADLFFNRAALILSWLIFVTSIIWWRFMHPGLANDMLAEILVESLFIGFIAMFVSYIREIIGIRGSQLEKTREQEQLERERLVTLINSMGDGVIAFNEHGTIRIFNAATLNLLDTNADLTGRSVDVILNLRDPGGSRVKLTKLAKGLAGNKVLTDLKHAFSDKEMINLYINISPINLGYKRRGERGYILIMRDITKEKTLEEEHDEFIAVVSHELRTPIAIAEGNLSNALLLEQKEVSRQIITDALQDSHEQILFLAKMINDLSTLSRAERGIGKDDIEPVDIYRLLDELHSNYQPQAAKKNLRLTTKALSKIDPLKTNKLYIEEILQNFITNSIKYTSKGGVTVTAEQDQAHRVIFTVKDTGIGISKTDQKHVFEKFFRSEDYRTRESSGTGLGLYLVQKLAPLINARIDFTSRLNHGSVFTIVVSPITAPSKEAKQVVTASPTAPTVSP
ncbi:MAG TPA: ATP-binding protein [Candidatus Saccharimonadales bacterium]|nr:ATP-binding protein [Candidatus Saccharimonadales bacterium]